VELPELAMSEISTADGTWVNAAADRFEQDWKAGPRPKIEDYLAEVDESRRTLLLAESLSRKVFGGCSVGTDPGCFF
jgi:hypothetical protein